MRANSKTDIHAHRECLNISIKEYEDTISATKFIDENCKSLYYCVIGCGKTFTLDEASEDRCPHCLSSRIAPYMR